MEYYKHNKAIKLTHLRSLRIVLDVAQFKAHSGRQFIANVRCVKDMEIDKSMGSDSIKSMGSDSIDFQVLTLVLQFPVATSRFRFYSPLKFFAHAAT